MKSFKTSEINHLEWGIEIQGIDYKQLQGSIKFIVDNIEYGIPVSIHENNIVVDIPPLQSFIKNLQSKEIESRLEIFGDGFYMKPWQENIKVEIPASIKVEMIEEKQKDQKIIKTVLKETSSKKPPNLEQKYNTNIDKLNEALKSIKDNDKYNLDNLLESANLKNSKIKNILIEKIKEVSSDKRKQYDIMKKILKNKISKSR